MTSAYHFFLKHGGYAYRPDQETKAEGRIRCAKEAAQAERDAKRFGLRFTWEWDDTPDLSFMTPEEQAEEHEVLGCVVRDPSNRVRASLWGVVDCTPEYRRVIEAELAQEAFASVAHR